MANEELREYILRLKAEGSEEAAKSVEKITTRLEKLRSDVTEATQRFGAASHQQDAFSDANDRMARRVSKAYGVLQEAKDALEGLRQAAIEADRVFERADAIDEYSRRLRELQREAMIYGQIATRGRELGTLSRSLGAGGVGEGLYLASDIFDAIEALKRLPPELGKLAMQSGLALTNLVPLGAALGAVALAAGVYLSVTRDSKDATEDAIAGLRAWRESLRETTTLLLSGTTEDVEASIAQKEQELQAAIAVRDELQRVVTELEEQVAERLHIDLTKLLAPDVINLFTEGGGTEYRKLIEDLKEANNEVRVLETTLAQLEDGLDSTTVAANDLDEAERRLAALRTQMAMDRIDTEMQVYDQARSLSSDQARTQLDRIRAEREVVEEELRLATQRKLAGEDMNDTIRELAKRNGDLIESERMLVEQVLPLIEAREREAEVLEATGKVIDEMTDFLERQAEAAERRAELERRFEQQTEDVDFQRRRQDEREHEDYLRKRQKDRAKLAEDLADLDVKTAEERADILEEMAEDEAEHDAERAEVLRKAAEEDVRETQAHRRRIRDINRQTSRDLEDALADRNVTAAIRAVEAGEEQLEAEAERFAEEQALRDKALDDTLKQIEAERREKKLAGQQALRDLQVQHQQERAARIAAFQRQIQDEDAERRIRLDRLAADRAYEDQLRRRSHEDAIAGLNALISKASQFRTVAGSVPSGGASGGGTWSGGPGTNIVWRTVNGRSVRADVYDPSSAAGMTAGEWYAWKQAGMPSSWSVAAHGTSGGYTGGVSGGTRQPTPYAGGYSMGRVQPGTVLWGDVPELAQFNKDGSWRIYNERQITMMQPTGDSFDIRIDARGASDPAAIRAMFEADVLPRLVTAVRSARERSRARR